MLCYRAGADTALEAPVSIGQWLQVDQPMPPELGQQFLDLLASNVMLEQQQAASLTEEVLLMLCDTILSGSASYHAIVHFVQHWLYSRVAGRDTDAASIAISAMFTRLGEETSSNLNGACVTKISVHMLHRVLGRMCLHEHVKLPKRYLAIHVMTMWYGVA